jgi:hypothetical protein
MTVRDAAEFGATLIQNIESVLERYQTLGLFQIRESLNRGFLFRTENISYNETTY